MDSSAGGYAALGRALHTIDATLHRYDWARDRPGGDLATPDDWADTVQERYPDWTPGEVRADIDDDPLLVGYDHPVAGSAAFTVDPRDSPPLTGGLVLPDWDAVPRDAYRDVLESEGWEPDRAAAATRHKRRAPDHDRLADVREEMLEKHGTPRLEPGENPSSVRYTGPDRTVVDHVEQDVEALATVFEQVALAGLQLDG